MECNHNRIRDGYISRYFASENFKAKGTICLDCKAQLWDNDAEAKFEAWLGKKLKDPKFKGKLKVQQIPLTQESIDLIEELKARYYVDESRVLQALLSVYVNKIDGNASLRDILNEMTPSTTIVKYKSGVRLNPVVFRRLNTIADVFELSLAACAGEIVNRMSAVIYDVNSLPTTSIRSDVETAVAA